MIEQQFAELQGYLRQEKGLESELQRLATGGHLVTVRKVSLGAGWRETTADMLFLAPPGYPAARPDCFWVSPQVRLANGSPPQNTNEGNPIPGDPAAGRPLTWFSWHLQSWDPNTDKLVNFYRAAVQRLIPAR